MDKIIYGDYGNLIYGDYCIFMMRVGRFFLK